MLHWILFVDFWFTMFLFQHSTKKDCQYGINRTTDMKAYPFSSVLRRQFPPWMVCLLFFNCRSTKFPLPLFVGQIINYAFFLFFCIERYVFSRAEMFADNGYIKVYFMAFIGVVLFICVDNGLYNYRRNRDR